MRRPQMTTPAEIEIRAGAGDRPGEATVRCLGGTQPPQNA